MRGDHQRLCLALLTLAVAVAALDAGRRLAAPRDDGSALLQRELATFRAALERYRADHGWYPGDPDRDWNSDGRADLLRRQLTSFTRDDGKPQGHPDAEFRFGPYLRDLPRDPVSGQRTVVLDQDRARPLPDLRRSIASGGGRGGWYYEPRTGNVVANHGRPETARFASF